jgi:general stress protein 26
MELRIIPPEIWENNVIIARYMTDEPDVLERDLLKAGTIECMYYHDEWEWIMEVVEKIRINTKIHILLFPDKSPSSVVVIDTKGFNTMEKSNNLISAIWNACINYINWYNETKLSQHN